MNTLPLFPDDWFFTPPENVPGESLSSRFKRFHEANPWVYRHIERMALEMAARGHRRIGVKMLAEVLRWQYAMRTSDPTSTFRINNSYVSRYSRLLAERQPQLAPLIETRRLKSV